MDGEHKGLIQETDVSSFQPPRGRRPELAEEGREGLQGNCINQQATRSLREGLLERTELHHLAHGAPSGKQRNDQVTLWTLRPQQASAVVLISGVPWLSSSAPLKPLTKVSPCSRPSALFLLSTLGGRGHGGGRDTPPPPPHPILAGDKQRRAKGSVFLSPVLVQFSTKAARVSFTLPPLRLLSPQLAQGMESIISLCWLPES